MGERQPNDENLLSDCASESLIVCVYVCGGDSNKHAARLQALVPVEGTTVSSV